MDVSLFSNALRELFKTHVLTIVKQVLVKPTLTRVSVSPVSADHLHYRRSGNIALTLTYRYDNNNNVLCGFFSQALIIGLPSHSSHLHDQRLNES